MLCTELIRSVPTSAGGCRQCRRIGLARGISHDIEDTYQRALMPRWQRRFALIRRRCRACLGLRSTAEVRDAAVPRLVRWPPRPSPCSSRPRSRGPKPIPRSIDRLDRSGPRRPYAAVDQGTSTEQGRYDLVARTAGGQKLALNWSSDHPRWR